MASTEQRKAERVSLGRTSIQVSPLGVGTWQWGDRGWGYGRTYTDADLRAAFDAAVASGINFFDSAEIYGNGRSETLVGKFVRESGPDVVVASKLMPWPWRLRGTGLIDAIRSSLDRLGMERLDLYYIHWPIYLWPGSLERTADSLADAVEEGLVRSVGVSNHSVKQMRRVARVLKARNIPLACNQVRYNLLDRKPERNGVLEACRQMGVTMVAYSPLAQGLLTGKYTPSNPPSGMRGFMSRRKLTAIRPLFARMREIGEAHGGKTLSQVALNWLICKGAVPIPGAKNAQQVEQNAGALGWRLTQEELEQLDQASA
jgi:aryl-alcohol dehydrogenase-like predicted oxidoreductase